MNPDRFTSALGLAGPLSPGSLPLAAVDDRPVTFAAAWSQDAMGVAARRGTPLVIVGGDSSSAPPTELEQPWPVVAVSETPWDLRAADLGLLVGRDGPADHSDLDEVEAAALTRSFLRLSFDGPPRDPAVEQSLLDIVPFPFDEPYDPEPLLRAVLDSGEWVELDRGSADEVVTAVGRFGGRSVGVAASRPRVDGGRLGVEAVARIARLGRWCRRGNRPLVTMVDSAGMRAPTDGGELQLISDAASSVRNSDVAKIAIVTGRAVGLAATIMAAVGGRADAVIPWPRAHFALDSKVPLQPGSDESSAAQVGRAAREGDVMDVIHPDDTRDRIIEWLDLLRGRREYAS